MVMAAVQQEELRWDLFLDLRMEGLPDDQRARQWMTLKHWRDSWNSNIPPHAEKTEPHWVAPRIAILWMKRDSLVPLSSSADSSSQDWVPTQEISVGGYDALDYYLGLGYRIRPPSGASVELESARPAGPVSEKKEATKPPPIFFCHNPIHGQPMGFYDWNAYIQHCNFWREKPVETPPDEVREKMARSPYYCLQHDVEFINDGMAAAHVSLWRARNGYHVTVEQMRTRTSDPPPTVVPAGKQSRTCPVCGGKKHRNSKQCRDCYNKAKLEAQKNG